MAAQQRLWYIPPVSVGVFVQCLGAMVVFIGSILTLAALVILILWFSPNAFSLGSPALIISTALGTLVLLTFVVLPARAVHIWLHRRRALADTPVRMQRLLRLGRAPTHARRFPLRVIELQMRCGGALAQVSRRVVRRLPRGLVMGAPFDPRLPGLEPAELRFEPIQLGKDTQLLAGLCDHVLGQAFAATVRPAESESAAVAQDAEDGRRGGRSRLDYYVAWVDYYLLFLWGWAWRIVIAIGFVFALYRAIAIGDPRSMVCAAIGSAGLLLWTLLLLFPRAEHWLVPGGVVVIRRRHLGGRARYRWYRGRDHTLVLHVRDPWLEAVVTDGRRTDSLPPIWWYYTPALLAAWNSTSPADEAALQSFLSDARR